MGEASRRPKEVRLAVTTKGHGVFKGAYGRIGSLASLRKGRHDSVRYSMLSVACMS